MPTSVSNCLAASQRLLHVWYAVRLSKNDGRVTRFQQNFHSLHTSTYEQCGFRLESLGGMYVTSWHDMKRSDHPILYMSRCVQQRDGHKGRFSRCDVMNDSFEHQLQLRQATHGYQEGVSGTFNMNKKLILICHPGTEIYSFLIIRNPNGVHIRAAPNFGSIGQNLGYWTRNYTKRWKVNDFFFENGKWPIELIFWLVACISAVPGKVTNRCS